MSYRLSTKDDAARSASRIGAALRRLLPLMPRGAAKIVIAFVAILLTSAATLASPYIIGQTVDHFIAHGDYSGVITQLR